MKQKCGVHYVIPQKLVLRMKQAKAQYTSAEQVLPAVSLYGVEERGLLVLRPVVLEWWLPLTDVVRPTGAACLATPDKTHKKIHTR